MNINQSNLNYENFRLAVGIAMVMEISINDNEKQRINEELSKLWKQESCPHKDSPEETLFVL